MQFKYRYIYLIFLFLTGVWSAESYNLELVSNIESITESNSSSDFGVSDVWGYTDETGIEYAIVGYRYGTFIFDVSSDPSSPLLVADILGPSNGDYYYHRDYKTYNDHLYIVNEMSGADEGMQVIDLSPLPELPPIKRPTYTGISQSHNLWIDEELGYAFIENQYQENVHIVSLQNPDFPYQISSLSYLDGENCHDVFTENNIAYISEGYSYEFGVYDISNILSPVKLASIPSFGYAHNAWLNESGTHLVTGEETVGMTVKIWDIQDLDNINLVGEYLGENSLAHNVHVKGDFIYISHYTTGIKIVDIFNPSDPIEVAAFDTFHDDDNNGFYGCWGAYPFTSNNYIYASDMQYGLFVFAFNNIKAGWIYGRVIDQGFPVSGLEIRSTLNGRTFITDLSGEYSFGFPECEQEFELYLDGDLISTQNITIYPHQNTEFNILLGLNGDLNGDGIQNILDIILLSSQILLNEYNNSYDLNNDQQLNILDIIILVNIILDI